MSTLREVASEYLQMRRTLGFKLTTFGQRLMSLVAYCEARNIEHLTVAIAVEWATTTPRSSDPVHHARRLDVARIFARHLAIIDPATEVPGLDVLPHRYRRAVPYQYSLEQIEALIDAAATLQPVLRAATWRTLIGLLAVTGMRDGEAARLCRDDVDLDEGVVTITESKFAKSRLVYLHPTTVTALREYVITRDRLVPEPASEKFFVNGQGRPLTATNLSHTFAQVRALAGLQGLRAGKDPRLHDLRHTFTIATMLDWYRDSGDVQARLPVLSTWLGHVDPKSTYWYLQAVPELLALAAARLDHEDPREGDNGPTTGEGERS